VTGPALRSLAAALLAAACGGPAKGTEAPDPGAELSLTVQDVIVPGEAIVMRTTMHVLATSALTAVLLEGLERQSAAAVPRLARALEVTGRAPLEEADEIVVTGRPLDEDSALLAVAVSYSEDVDWFEDFVLAFHEGPEEPGVLSGIEQGAVLGVLVRDTRISYDTTLSASVCAVRFTPRLVAYLAAPDPGECRVWASWVIARGRGDEDLLERLDEAPEIGGAPPPVGIYVDGLAFEDLCCAPFGLSAILAGVEEAWVGLDPGSPAILRLRALYGREEAARAQRDSLARILDAYAPTIRLLVPGLGKALDSMSIEAQGRLFLVGLTVDGETTRALADLLSTML
jgi:hypothetical protein